MALLDSELGPRRVHGGAVAYNIAISACEKACRWLTALGLLREARRRGLQHTVVTCNSATTACSRGGRWDGAHGLLEELLRSWFQPDVIAFNSAIGAVACGTVLSATLRWTKALALLGQIFARRLRPSVVSCSAAVNACATIGCWVCTLLLLGNLTWIGLECDVVVFGAAIHSCEQSERWERALGLLPTLVRATIKTSGIAMNAAASACEKRAQWASALALLQDVHAKGLRFCLVMCNAALSACARGAACWMRALELFEAATREPLQPSAITISATICACAKGAQASHALRLLGGLGRRSLERDAIIVGAALTACENARSWVQTLHLLASLQWQQLEYSTVMHNAAVGACMRGRRWVCTLILLSGLGRRRGDSNVITHDTSLCACEEGERAKHGPCDPSPSARAAGTAIRRSTGVLWKSSAAVESMKDSEGAVNIFNINDDGGAVAPTSVTATLSAVATSLELPEVARDFGRELSGLFSRWAAPEVVAAAGRGLRSVLDPSAEQQRRGQRRSREVLCLLNEIDQRLVEAHRQLAVAASSMQSFGENHASGGNAGNLVGFIRDAVALQRSAVLPDQLEAKFSGLEGVADTFRSLPVQLGEDGKVEGCHYAGDPSELQSRCMGLQVDVAVLLESALMTAQQAFAEYKRMLCRLQLFVSEYEPIYRQEISEPAPAPGEPTSPTSLLCLELRVASGGLDADVLKPEVQHALDFAQLVAGGAARELGALVRELGRRSEALRDCAGELRELLLRGPVVTAFAHEASGD